MKKLIYIPVALLCALVFLPANVFAADATLTLEAGSLGAGLGAKRGSGILTYKGHKIPFKYTGMSIGEIGVTSIKATGEVNNLAFLEKFNGCYRENKIDGTLGVGTDKQQLKNEAGVQLSLESAKKGLNLSISTGCTQLALDPNALKAVMAKLNEPPVKAQYQASIFFDTDSDKISTDQKETLNKVIALLEKQPSTEVIVTGYTDTTGAEGHNQELSVDRAKAVYSALRKKAENTAIVNLPPKRVEVTGRGQVKGPANKPEQKDRRVDILIIAPAQG